MARRRHRPPAPPEPVLPVVAEPPPALEIDEKMFCHLLGGGTISLSLVIGRTGYQRGEERLVAELHLSDGWQPALERGGWSVAEFAWRWDLSEANVFDEIAHECLDSTFRAGRRLIPLEDERAWVAEGRGKRRLTRRDRGTPPADPAVPAEDPAATEESTPGPAAEESPPE